MKALFIFLTTIVTAQIALAEGNRYVCRELSGPKMTVVIAPNEDQQATSISGSLYEGRDYPYTVEVVNEKDGRYSSNTYHGLAGSEDVMFDFKSYNSKVKVVIYLDELDASGISINGKKTDLNCY